MSLTPQQVYEYTLQQGDIIISPTYGPIPPPPVQGTFWSTSGATSYPSGGWTTLNNTGILINANGVKLGDNGRGLKVPPGRWKFEIEAELTGFSSVLDFFATLELGGNRLVAHVRFRHGATLTSTPIVVEWFQFVNLNSEMNVIPAIGIWSVPSATVTRYVMTATKLD